jgi:hypothetical protein
MYGIVHEKFQFRQEKKFTKFFWFALMHDYGKLRHEAESSGKRIGGRETLG